MVITSSKEKYQPRMAASLPNGNLIVPVIKNADQLNLVGMAKAVNDLGGRAKAGKLKPDDTQENLHSYQCRYFWKCFYTQSATSGNFSLGAIRKMPAVIETPEGDFIDSPENVFYLTAMTTE
jgi:2-oxoglutarate dehydrogenase E2 component (dihydrolipoamide succinyltransferase)